MFSISNNVVKVSEEKDQARMDPHEGILQAVKVWIEATSQLVRFPDPTYGDFQVSRGT